MALSFCRSRRRRTLYGRLQCPGGGVHPCGWSAGVSRRIRFSHATGIAADLELALVRPLPAPKCLADVCFGDFLVISGEYWNIGEAADKNRAKWVNKPPILNLCSSGALGGQMFGKCLVPFQSFSKLFKPFHGEAGIQESCQDGG